MNRDDLAKGSVLSDCDLILVGAPVSMHCIYRLQLVAATHGAIAMPMWL